MKGIIFVLIAITVSTQANVSFHLFTREQQQASIIDDHNKAKLSASNFKISRRTIFLVHGYKGNINSRTLSLTVTSLLNREDSNVIVVDWSKAAESPYSRAARNTRPVGDQIGKLIKFLKDSTSGSPLLDNRFYIVGYSLGAHVAGFAGRFLRSKGMVLDRITGLDPAGPSFTLVSPDDRLDPSDAEHVDVIHTAAGSYGTLRTDNGHIDFFPNGGFLQRGCSFKLLDPLFPIRCAHKRAVEYYLASVNSLCSWKACPCKSKIGCTSGDCASCGSRCPSMGFYADRIKVRGDFFLETNRESPFCAAGDERINVILRCLATKKRKLAK